VLDFRFSPSFLENLEAGLIFFVLEIVIVLLVLPLTLDQIQRRKWRPMRTALVQRGLEEAACALDHAVLAADAFERVDIAAMADLRRVDFTDRRPEEVRIADYCAVLGRGWDNYRGLQDTIDLFGPSIEPGAALGLVGTIDNLRDVLAAVTLPLMDFAVDVEAGTVKLVDGMDDDYLSVSMLFFKRRSWRDSGEYLEERRTALAEACDRLLEALKYLVEHTSLSRKTKREFRNRLPPFKTASTRLMGKLHRMAVLRWYISAAESSEPGNSERDLKSFLEETLSRDAAHFPDRLRVDLIERDPFGATTALETLSQALRSYGRVAVGADPLTHYKARSYV
jgi:hypothetical protein